jgi:predicted kinase
MICLEGAIVNEPFSDYMGRELEDRSVLISCGLPASYKTETTEVIAEIKGFTILRSDLIRLEVLAGEDIFDDKVASDMGKRTAVYDEMFRRAHDLAGAGQGIILDATFVTQKLRRRAAEVAARSGMTFVIQQTRCPEEVSLRRISERTKENYESNAISPVAYHNNVKKFEAVDLDDLKALHPDLDIVHLVVDTSSDATEDWRVVDRVTR